MFGVPAPRSMFGSPAAPPGELYRIESALKLRKPHSMKEDHQCHEMRSLRMHRLVADRYRVAPEDVIQFGLENLKRWRQQGVDCDDFEVWEGILRSSPQRLPEVLCGFGEEATRLRQSSPFAGLIPEESRQQILATAE
jgi:hypothetical protein